MISAAWYASGGKWKLTWKGNCNLLLTTYETCVPGLGIRKLF